MACFDWALFDGCSEELSCAEAVVPDLRDIFAVGAEGYVRTQEERKGDRYGDSAINGGIPGRRGVLWRYMDARGMVLERLTMSVAEGGFGRKECMPDVCC